MALVTDRKVQAHTLKPGDYFQDRNKFYLIKETEDDALKATIVNITAQEVTPKGAIRLGTKFTTTLPFLKTIELQGMKLTA